MSDLPVWIMPGGTEAPNPGAMEIRMVGGYVRVGKYLVRYCNRWGDERFPWVVQAPGPESYETQDIESFPQFREALAFARRLARGETQHRRLEIHR